MTDDDGRFTFVGVPNGDYVLSGLTGTNAWTPAPSSPGFLLTVTVVGNVLQAPRRPADEPLFWLEEPVTVGTRPVSGIRATLRPGFRVSGRFEFEGTAEPMTPNQLQYTTVDLIPLAGQRLGSAAPADVRGTTFTSAPNPPGRYRVSTSFRHGDWRLSAIALDGHDLLDEALEIIDHDIEGVVLTFTTAETTLSGAVRQSSPDAVDATVVAFPAAVESWIRAGMLDTRAKSTRADPSGVFVLHNLRPGDYIVAAIGSGQPFDLADPDFVRRLAPLGQRVSVRPGANATPAIALVGLR